MSKQDQKATEKRIAQLEAEMARETRNAAKRELGVTIETLKAKLAR